MIHREYGIYIEKRQDFLTSRGWSTKAQSRTVLLTGIPDDYCNIEALQALTDNMPGGVRKIWLARDVKNLAEVYDRRIKAVKKLEAADNKVIKLANKLVRKKKVDANGDENLDATEKMQDTPVLAKYIPEKKRPTHRLGKIPFTGQKVDTISWALEEIESTTKELERERQDVSKYKPKSSAFILFNDQISAHIFAQVLTHELPLRMSGRYINVGLDDVIWQSMNINPYSQKLRRVAMLAATAAIIIFWSPLTAFVTSISNVSNLCTTVSWLSWLCNLGTPLNVSAAYKEAIESVQQIGPLTVSACRHSTLQSRHRVSFKASCLHSSLLCSSCLCRPSSDVSVSVCSASRKSEHRWRQHGADV